MTKHRPIIVYAPQSSEPSESMQRVLLNAAERDLRDFQTRYGTEQRSKRFASALGYVAKALAEIERAKSTPRGPRR